MVIRIQGAEDADVIIRRHWGEQLEAHMKAHEMNRKQLKAALEEQGISVTEQAISMWRLGQMAPRPSVQIALGKVFKVPPRSLFPLTIEVAA